MTKLRDAVRVVAQIVQHACTNTRVMDAWVKLMHRTSHRSAVEEPEIDAAW